MLSFQNMSLRRNGELLIEQLSLTIYQGQKVGLVGANGIGKTSLFKLILGELDADIGQLGLSPGTRIAHMAQEIPGADVSALEYVVSGDSALVAVRTRLAQAEQNAQFDKVAQLFEELKDLDGFSAEARAEQLLVGLGFDEATFNNPLKSFSGGWRVRLNLARTLMKPSDLLLLDEPTNHLDLDAIFWLASWIQGYQGTLILISHDREFLDDCVLHIAYMANQKVMLYSGNYTAFETLRAEQLLDQTRQFEKQQKSIHHMEDFIRRFRYKESKARQAQSRIKALERLTRVEAVHEASPFRFSIREASRQSDPLLQLRDANLGYDKPILSNLNLSFSPGDRFGLLGVNGAGKSTLVKSLEGTLPLIDGERIEGLHLKTGYFSQHQVDDLDLQMCPLEHLQQLDPKANELKLRTFLGGFSFQGEQVETKAANFSGGEKARLALAIVSFQQPNLLLLDEPTNHLDMQMRQALATAMNTFEGAILVISHDRYLLSSTVDAFLLIRDGRIQPFEGTLSDYRSGLEAKPGIPDDATSRAMTTTSQGEAAAASSSSTMVGQAPKSDHKRQRQITTRLKTIETRLARLSEKVSLVEQALSDPQHYSDPDSPTLQGLLRDRESLQSQTGDLEEEWLGLESERESLG